MSTVSPGSTASVSSFTSMSPPYPEQREPLSLVVRDMRAERNETPRTAKHWKKSISRNFSSTSGSEENQENGPVSPCTNTTAEALLSLRNVATPAVPQAPRVLPVALAPSRPVSSSHRIVQPWALPVSQPSHTKLSPITLSVRKDLSDISNVCPVLFPSHPLPPIHFKAESEPETPARLVSLPQQPTPLREVQSNLQLSRQPLPLSLTSQVAWHQPQHGCHTNQANKPLFRHSIFTSENIEEGSATGDKPFHCHECKKSFSTQSGFAKHQQLHCSNQIQRDITCKYCNKAYNSQSALKMHIRTHTLPCKCEHCGKSFSRPWLLQGHLRTHTGEKPFACTECSRTFADKSNLRAHLQTHLQNKKYSCPGCQKTFSRMSLLNKHTDSGCLGLQSRNEECVETLIGLSSGLLRS